MRTSIDLITLGCSKNLVDTEHLMGRLVSMGYACTHDSARPKGEIAVINTCGFIGDAKEESINMILQFARRKQEGRLKKLYVMGCLSQRYRDELQAEIPEVDAWFGKFDFDKLLTLLNDQTKPASSNILTSCGYEQGTACKGKVLRSITTPSHYTYIKISEGCNRFCSYCAIPLITGRHTSRPMEDIINEMQWLARKGVKEFNIIAQDLSSYGLDLYGEHRLAQLLEQMAAIKGVRWIRLHYTYPTDFPLDILPVIASHDNICKYLDIALQHSSDKMLSLMRRHISSSDQDALIARIRREVPGITLRTTVLVGHPGETDDDFLQLLEWIKQMRFERLGAFAYSDEDGTYANLHYKDDIPDKIKQQRVEQVMTLQELITAEINATKIGSIIPVIIDRKEGDYFIGRTEADSPEVDCEVLIQSPLRISSQYDNDAGSEPVIGEIYPVLITDTEGLDLIGQIAATED